MIIENGTLQEVTLKSGGMLNGVPQKAEEILSSAIPCNIRTIKHDKRGRTTDGVFTQASYEVLVDAPCFHATKVKLFDNRCNMLGTFDVQDVQHLDAVGAIKIIV